MVMGSDLSVLLAGLRLLVLGESRFSEWKCGTVANDSLLVGFLFDGGRLFCLPRTKTLQKLRNRLSR